MRNTFDRTQRWGSPPVEISDKKLPLGWRYPAGRKHLREALDGIPDLLLKLDLLTPHSRWRGTRSSGLVIEASVTRALPSSPRTSVVHVYGQREADYPESAAGDLLVDGLA